MDEQKVLHWNPRYYVMSPAEDQLVLIDEIDSHLFQGESYRHLFLHIDGTRSMMDVIDAIDDIGSQASCLMTIDRLLEAGYLEERTASQPQANYHSPDFHAASERVASTADHVELTILSQFDRQELLVEWASALTLAAPTGVVMVDDYLDPRLAAIDLAYRQQRRPWLLIKPTGHQPLIGPYFTWGERETPCWTCLAVRLRLNQPVRHWLQGESEAELLPLPIHYDPEEVTRWLAMATPLAQQLIDQRHTCRLWAFDPASDSPVEHPVNFRPQCATCGDPYLFTQTSAARLSLADFEPSPKLNTRDGGYRSQTPEQTVAALEPVISRLTGVMHDVSELPKHHPAGVTTYRVCSFQTPWRQQRLNQNDFLQVSLGKGISNLQSQASALCETVERHTAQYQGDEPQLLGQARQLDARAVLPEALVPFSAQQYQQFLEPNPTLQMARQAVVQHDPDTPLNWTLGRTLTQGETIYVPLSYCYANVPFEDHRYVRWNSNGCAAGNTLAEAVLQGFLELVERDAVAIWWYNKIPRPAVDLQSLPAVSMQPLRQSLDVAWRYWVLDLTHDFEIPVMAAVSQHRETQIYRMGFGCHLDPVLACFRALTELCQLIAIEDRSIAGFRFTDILSEPYLEPDTQLPSTDLSTLRVVDRPDIRDDLRACTERAVTLGLEPIVVNYTRPDMPIYTAKVMMPGLCHMWPQLGAERLYTVPLTLGWQPSRLREDQLNPLALFV